MLYLGDYSARLYLRQISKLSGIPLKTTQAVLSELEKKGLLVSEVQGKNKYFTLNLENINTKSSLLQAEAQKTLLFMEKYAEFRGFMKELKNDKPVILFGSFASFGAGENSDADMLVISDESVELPKHLLPHRIHEIGMSGKEFSRAVEGRETLLEQVRKSHVVLSNHSFFVDMMWEKYAR